MSYAAHSLVAFIFISLHLQLIYLAVENELEDVDAPNPVHESLVCFCSAVQFNSVVLSIHQKHESGWQ